MVVIVMKLWLRYYNKPLTIVLDMGFIPGTWHHASTFSVYNIFRLASIPSDIVPTGGLSP